MHTYIITYDSGGIEEDYSGLVIQLCEFLAPCRRILDSVWLVQSNHTAEEILRMLRPHMPPKRGLLITRLAEDTAWTGFGRSETKFMREVL